MCELITEILHAALPCYRPGDLPRKSPLGPCVSQRSDAIQATPRPFDSGVGSGFCPASDESPWRPGPARGPGPRPGGGWKLVLRPGNPRPAAIGAPIPGFGRIGKRGFPPNRESGIPSPIPGGHPRFPAKSGIGGTGIGDFRVCLCHQLSVSFAPGIIVIT